MGNRVETAMKAKGRPLKRRSGNWRSAESMPYNRRVRVLTVMGLERVGARLGAPEEAEINLKPRDKHGPERVQCRDYPKHRNIWAIGWRPLAFPDGVTIETEEMIPNVRAKSDYQDAKEKQRRFLVVISEILVVKIFGEYRQLFRDAFKNERGGVMPYRAMPWRTV